MSVVFCYLNYIFQLSDMILTRYVNMQFININYIAGIYKFKRYNRSSRCEEGLK